MSDPVEIAVTEAYNRVRRGVDSRGFSWTGQPLDVFYAAALPAMVTAAVRASHADVCGCWSQADNDD